MSGVNKVILLGRLGNDPDMKQLAGGAVVTKFSLATSKSFLKDGQKHEIVEWHRIVAWNRQNYPLAENCAKYLTKGREVYIEGEIKTETWEKDGKKNYATTIVADNVQFIGGAAAAAPQQGYAQPQAQPQQHAPQQANQPQGGAPNLEEIPF